MSHVVIHPRRTAATAFVLIGVIGWLACFGRAAVPTSAPATRPAGAPPAIELIRDVMKFEEWLDTAHSVSIEAETVWHDTPEKLQQRRAELQKQFPNEPLTPERFAQLRPDGITARQHSAFDERRVLSRTETSLGDLLMNLWDGTKNYKRYRFGRPDGENSVGISRTLGEDFDSLFSRVGWPATRVHRLWFNQLTDGFEREEGQRISTLWESLWPEAAVRGPVQYGGRPCWVVLFRDQRQQRWYIGVADHRLYGTAYGILIKDDDPRYVAACARAAADRGGVVHSRKELFDWIDKWTEATPREERQPPFERVMGDVNIYLDLVDAPIASERRLNDYKEVAAGCWMPMCIDCVSRVTGKDGRVVIDNDSTITIKQTTVNQPLPDEWFAFSFDDADGAHVYDGTFSPPLEYTWRRDRTPDEWQQVFDDAAKRQAERAARQAARALLHKPAPAFGGGAWLNGPPQTWAGLKGRVVMLHCWAEWSAPCLVDLPQLRQLAGEAGTPVTVIGVHSAGSPLNKVNAHLQQAGIAYPVYVDTAGGGGFGALMAVLGVRALPQTIVVDVDGRIAAIGPLSETVPVARECVKRAAEMATTKPAGQ